MFVGELVDPLGCDPGVPKGYCEFESHHSLHFMKNKIAKCIKCNSEIEINKHASSKTCICVVCKTLTCNICSKPFIPKLKNQKFCSVSCTVSNNNMNRVISKEYKDTLSKSAIIAYKNGKDVYGGRTKWFNVETSNGEIRVQGTYEVRACRILDYWKSSNKIKDWEYSNDRYNYISEDNKEHTYLVDFKIINNDSSFYYIETKGYIRENDKLKWEAVRNLGYNLIVWFNKDLEREEFIIPW